MTEGAAAILGMACRLPGADDRAGFAELLFAGRSAITEIPADRWDWRRHHGGRGPDGAAALPDFASHSRWGGFLDGPVDAFDHGYFGLSPKEARLMDPQQRLLLQATVHALEDAGLDPAALRAPACRTAFYAGVMAQDFARGLGAGGVAPDGQSSLGSSAALLANRVSHQLGFSGESVTLDAACASGLVALHLARRALVARECDVAVVGAVSLLLTPWRHIGFSQARMLSPRGRCATFDAEADGYVPGEGVVVLVLRRLAEAEGSGARIQAVLRGSATGHVGGGHSVTAPSVAAQRRLVAAAAASAGVSLASLSYLEAHGTGTALGDPIEVEALRQAFCDDGAPEGGCGIGSAKTNIGHLEPVAGLAGVAKVLLMLQARRLAPTLNLTRVNPLIDFARGPFRPVLAAAPWEAAEGRPRRAGVSAFGFGGAMAHAILEEAPPPAAPPAAPAAPLLLSAQSRAAFAALWQRWRDAAAGELPLLPQVAAHLARGRAALRWRQALPAGDPAALRQALAAEPAPQAATAPPGFVLRLVAGGGPAGAVEPLARALLQAVAPRRPLRLEADAACLPLAQRLAAGLTGVLALESGAWQPPPPISAGYLAALRDALVEEDSAEAEALLSRARELAGSNLTFQTYLAAWRQAGAAPDREAAPGTPARRLALLAGIVALRRLHQKWQLPERHAGLGAAWFEAASLVAAGLLPEAAAAAWLAAPASGLDALAASAEARRGDGDPPLPRLQDSAAPPPGVAPPLPGEALTLVVDPTADLPALLGRLWQAGAAVDWRGVLPAVPAPAGLPAYPFEPHRHPLALPPLPPARGTLPLAAAHVIGGRALLPAAAMARRLAEAAPAGLAALEFRRPAPPEAALALRLDAGSAGLALRDAEGALLALAEPAAAPPAATAPFAAPSLCFEAEAAYAALAGLGHAYGPALRPVAALRQGPGGWLAELAGDQPEAQTEAMLDGGLQACLLAALSAGLASGDRPLLPAAADRLWLRDPLAESCPPRLTALVPRDRLRAGPRGFVADLTLLDAAGAAWAVAEGLRFLPETAPPAAEALPLRQLAWQAADLAPLPPGPVLVLGGGARGEALAARLPAARFLPQIPEILPSAAEIVWLGALDHAATPEAAGDFVAGALLPLLGLLRRLTAGDAPPCRLRLVTRGRHAVLPGERVAQPIAALVAALGKVARQEAPDRLQVVTIDLPEQVAEADLAGLAAAPVEDPLGEAALRAGAVFVPRLLPLAEAVPAADPGAGGVQVIAGGAGGLGRRLALRLAATERASLLLLGRRAVPPGIEAFLQSLRQAGAPQAAYLAVDITDEAALCQALAGFRAWGPVRGVIQAAMQLADQRLAETTPESFARALAPKLAGTLALFAATRADAPRRFQLFSSALTLRGNAGQAGYLAGCAAQEALCEWMAAQGIPACVVQWGLWGDAGRVAQPGRLARITEATGLLPFPAEAGLQAWSRLPAQAVPRLVAARLDPRWEASLATTADPWTDWTGRLAPTEADPLETWADRHAAAGLGRGLAAAGLLPGAAGEAEADWRRRLGPVLPSLAAATAALPGLLLRQGVLRRDADGLLHAVEDSPAPIPAAARDWAEAAAPCLAAWPAVLAGQLTGEEILVPGGDPARLAALRLGLPAARARRAALFDLLRDLVRQAGRPLRLLHWQAGDGPATAALAAALEGLPVELAAGDRSPAMRAALAAQLPGLPLLPPEAAPVEGFDLLLALDGLPDPAEAARLLAPGGLLLADPPGALRDWQQAVLGLHPAAWQPPHSGAAEAWRQAGFDRLARPGGALLARRGAAALPSAERPPAPLLTELPMPVPAAEAAPAPDPLLPAVIAAVAEAVELPEAEIDPAGRFIEMGVDSIVAAGVAEGLRRRLGRRLPVHLFGDHPTPAALAAHLAASATPPAPAAPAVPAAGPLVATPMPDPRPASEAGEPLAILRQAVAEVLGLPAEEIGAEAGFAELGIDSVTALRVADIAGAALGRRLPLYLFGDCPTPAALARHLGAPEARPAPVAPPPIATLPAAVPPAAAPSGRRAAEDVAIIGMAGRFPGADDLDAFWALLESGRSAIGPVPPGRWTRAELAALAPGLDPARLGLGGFLADIEAFDAALFGLSPREAAAMDPQQRLLLETAWQALADAGLADAPAALRARAGVWIGAGTGDWPLKQALAGTPPDRVSLVGQLGASLAARLAHVFRLQGPAVTVDAACASAVAALAAALAALRNGEVDLAVVGAVAVMTTPQMAALAEAAGLLSAGGRCAALAEGADGMLLGEGVGVVVLRRLPDALAEGQPPHALLRAARMGHDGGGGLGISTPSAEGQARLARAVLAEAALPPAAIGWLEAHGTGTAAGDGTEIAAAAAVFADRAARPALGSLKPAIGHGLAAAGMAGLLKAVLQLRHGRLAPTAGLQGAAPMPELAGAGFLAGGAARPWEAAAGQPRRALVNVFALNGANGMLLVEEAPPRPALDSDGPLLLLVTAGSEPALQQRLASLAAWLRRHPAVSLPAFAAALAGAAAPLPWRAALLAESRDAALAQLEAAAAGRASPLLRRGQALRREAGTQALLAATAAGLLQGRPGRDALLAAAELFSIGVPLALPTARAAPLLLPGQVFDRAGLQDRATPAPDGDRPLRRLLAEVLRLPPGTLRDDSLPVALGLDSLLALELRQRLARELGAGLPLPLLLGGADLATLEAALAAAGPAATLRPDPAGQHDPFPLTALQQAYWVGRSDSMPLGGPCHGYWEIEATRPWDPAALEAALNTLVARHPMLRAVFLPDGRQRVLPEVPPCRLERPGATRPLAALRAEFAALRFDPARWPLFRVALSEGPEGQRLHLAVDLLIVDVPSLFLLLSEWSALLRGEALPAPPPASFRDWVLQAQPVPDAAALEFWRQAGPALPPAPALPGARMPEAGAVPAAHRHATRLSPAAWARFRAQAAAAGVTPANAVLAAFAEVLSHWAVEKSFTLNLTLMQRGDALPGIQAVLGDFTTTLLLDLDLTAAEGFAARAQRAVRDRLALLLAHAGQSGLAVLRDLARTDKKPRLMPVVFTSMLQHRENGLAALGRLSHGITRTPQVWLDCHIHEDAEAGLVACWDALDGLFPDGLIATMFSAFAAALERLAGDAAAWSQELRGWIAGEEAARRVPPPLLPADTAPPELLHEPFLRQALARPEAIAVITPEAALSYGALLGQALAVAAALPPEPQDRLVAVILPKGAAQVAAVLGASLAGRAYLPLDPALPPARLRQLLARGEATTLLTDSATEAALLAEWPAGSARLLLDRLAPLPAAAPPPRVAPDALAYVIFTSGSTGEPKGVMLDHAAAGVTLRDINQRFALTPADRVLGLSALSFDLSVWDIFGTLGAGAALVLPAPRSVADPAHLAMMVQRHGVTVWNSVPMFLQLLLEGAPTADSLASLRLVMLSGDWIPPALPPRFRALNSHASLISLGGATEAAIWSIQHPIEPALRPGWGSIPYGRALRGQSFRILDEALRDCPDGVPGELFIGGAGLAQGYWRDPARTAERFVTDPASGERLYRTGDLGRWREEGLIEFLGRRDGQVKLGGHRVELGEVEAALAALPGILQAVAVAPADAAGQRRLHAFCVAAAPADPAALRAALAARLPAYMVPASLRLLPALPRNANDKVDRAALERLAAAGDAPAAPGPASGKAASQQGLEVQRNTASLASRLLAIWRAELDDPTLPEEANLFEHGVTSFSAVRAAARISREIGPCAVTDLFEFPSVAALARQLAGRMPAAPAPEPETEPQTDPLAARAARRRAARALALVGDRA
ncbi:amino acid adenylation domain-containing protein [Roseomonas sp. USHLN139]|uniref:amino acid adenylation domain-containing protein n=1 Tax=Roseomonas sp. USHLN139 TaxID=3081298 RepID=UPI003B01ABA8